MNEFWRKWSIGTQLVAAHAMSLFAVLVIFAAGVCFLFWHNLTDSLQRELGREFEVVESLIEVTSTGAVRWRGDDQHDEAEYEGGPIAAEVWAAPGELLTRTQAAETGAPGLADLDLDWDATGFDVVRLGGERVRLLQGQHTVAGHQFVIRVYRSETPIREVTAMLAWTLLFGLLLALTLAVVTSRRIIVRLILEPLARMAAHARLIGAEHSGGRLPIANPDDELGQLGAVINGAFSRLEEAAARLRRFTADASHELRTPLTSLRSVGEICLRGERSADAYRDAIGSMLEDVESLTRLVDSLLLLSKADEGNDRLSKEFLPITAVLHQAEEVMAVLAEQNDQTIEVTGDDSLRATVDETVLRLALINLLDNAVKYGARGSVIEVDVTGVGRQIQIDVHNEGEGIAPEHRDRVFDRFYRVDSGRSRTAGGSGLGLSIARWAVEVHGGTLNVEVDGRAGVTFRVRLPGEAGSRR